MEKPKKVKIPAKGGKTGAQKDLERIKNLETLLDQTLDVVMEQTSLAGKWEADFGAMSQAFHAKSEEAKRLNEINDSLNQQLHSLSRKEMDSKSSCHQPTQECVGESVPNSALDIQEGGDHYKKLGHYQPWEVLSKWMKPDELKGFMKGTVIAYLAREEDKGGRLDIKKAMHTIQLYLELTKEEE
jgi:hypothetical protein